MRFAAVALRLFFAAFLRFDGRTSLVVLGDLETLLDARFLSGIVVGPFLWRQRDGTCRSYESRLKVLVIPT
jgi:hypothetical protein